MPPSVGAAIVCEEQAICPTDLVEGAAGPSVNFHATSAGRKVDLGHRHVPLLMHAGTLRMVVRPLRSALPLPSLERVEAVLSAPAFAVQRQAALL